MISMIYIKHMSQPGLHQHVRCNIAHCGNAYKSARMLLNYWTNELSNNKIEVGPNLTEVPSLVEKRL